MRRATDSQGHSKHRAIWTRGERVSEGEDDGRKGNAEPNPNHRILGRIRSDVLGQYRFCCLAVSAPWTTTLVIRYKGEIVRSAVRARRSALHELSQLSWRILAPALSTGKHSLGGDPSEDAFDSLRLR